MKLITPEHEKLFGHLLHREKTTVYTSMKDMEERLSKKTCINPSSYPLQKSSCGLKCNRRILIGENFKAGPMEIIRNKMIQ